MAILQRHVAVPCGWEGELSVQSNELCHVLLTSLWYSALWEGAVSGAAEKNVFIDFCDLLVDS